VASIKLQFMNNGIVKFFDTTRGFGFIKDTDSSEEYFVHSSGLNDTISENDEVTFELKQGKKGLNAVNVKLA
jgi:cold shock protein